MTKDKAVEKSRIIATNRPVEVFCEKCNSLDNVFMTNKEIGVNTTIQQNCSKCCKWTTWRLK